MPSSIGLRCFPRARDFWETRDRAITRLPIGLWMNGSDRERGGAPMSARSPKLVDHRETRLAEVTKLPVDRIHAKAPLDEDGVDSLMTIQFTETLESEFGELPKTLLFEVQTSDDLARYLYENKR